MEKKEEQLFEQLQLFRVLMDNIPNPVFYKDTEGVYLGYNKAFRDFHGLHNDSYIGKTVFDLPISREEAILHHKADKELLKARGIKTYGSALTCPDGSARYIILKKAVFSQADGTIGGIVGVVTDITELKKAAEDLKKSEERFKDLSEASLEAILFIKDGVIIDANYSTYKMFGYDAGEVIGRNVLDFIIPEARNATKERIATHNEEKYETIALKKDGDSFPIEVYPRELDLKGKPIRISVLRDLTEQKSMEEEVLKSKNFQSIGTLAGGIAHDFNNLLMAIVGNISLAKMNIPRDGKAAGFLNEAERIAFMGKNLTHQLLTFSRGGDPVRKIVHIGTVLKEITEKILGGSLIKAQYTIPEGLLRVEIDEDQIKQVIQNMVMNAKEAMPSGGTLSISCENVNITPQNKLSLIKEDYVRISIQDEGYGIPEENLSKIFDPYFTTKGMGPEKGVGLGLAICYSIVKKHNGYILIDSVPNKGTTFQIYLPAYRQEAVDIPGEMKVIRYDKGRILVMDDEEMILKIAKELLQYMGYEVVTTQNGEETIRLYRQAMELKKPFDVAILDLAIPGRMGGKEVVQELAFLDPHVKAIISSGYLNDPIIRDFQKYGFSGILTKPYDAKELDEKLQYIIKAKA